MGISARISKSLRKATTFGLRQTDNLLEAASRISRQSDEMMAVTRQLDDLADDSIGLSQELATQRLKTMARQGRLSKIFDPDDMNYIDNMTKSRRDNITKLQNDLANATDDAEKASILKKLNNQNKELKFIDETLNSIASKTELDEFKTITRRLEHVDKSSSFCSNNPKFCLAAAGGAAVTAFYTVAAWNSLEEEQRECLAVCYPDDFKTSNPPTYKTQNAVSPLNNEIRYAELYPEMADTVCTPDNMAKSGATNCDQFCKSKCDYDFDDIAGQILREVGEDAGNAFEEFFASVLGKNWKWWALLIISILITMVSVPFVLQFVRS